MWVSRYHSIHRMWDSGTPFLHSEIACAALAEARREWRAGFSHEGSYVIMCAALLVWGAWQASRRKSSSTRHSG